MKVNIRITSKDNTGEVSKTDLFAVMEVRQSDYKLVYVEDLSGEGITTKSTMIIGEDAIRIIRDGEVKSDFIYGVNMTHNTTYETQYGGFPVTIVTNQFDISIKGNEENSLKLGKSFMISAHVNYDLSVGPEALGMDMNIEITPCDDNINV